MNTTPQPEKFPNRGRSAVEHRAVTAQAIADSIAQADLQIATWLDGLAEKVNAARNQYWRGVISNNEFQNALDRALEEMSAVSRLLRFRPIQITRPRG
jgi:predicted carbohydrate-binding protein with CBM5 and CBM33 domain